MFENTGVERLVIPVRPGINNDALKYALRSWAKVYGDTFDVTIVGGRPQWFQGHHLPTVQHVGTNYQWSLNFPNAMRAVVTADLGLVWWTADDIFALNPVTVETGATPTWCRRSDLNAYIESWRAKKPQGYAKAFVDGIASQAAILEDLGVSTQHNADLHLPHLIDTDKLGELLNTLDTKYPDHPAGHFRAIYGGLWPGDVRRVNDPKVTGHAMFNPLDGFTSTAHSSWWSVAGHKLRKELTKPTRWERR